jgi:hypothetical protein
MINPDKRTQRDMGLVWLRAKNQMNQEEDVILLLEMIELIDHSSLNYWE